MSVGQEIEAVEASRAVELLFALDVAPKSYPSGVGIWVQLRPVGGGQPRPDFVEKRHGERSIN